MTTRGRLSSLQNPRVLQTVDDSTSRASSVSSRTSSPNYTRPGFPPRRNKPADQQPSSSPESVEHALLLSLVTGQAGVKADVERIMANVDSKRELLSRQHDGVSVSLPFEEQAAPGLKNPRSRRPSLGNEDDTINLFKSGDDGLVALGIGDLISLTLSDVGLLVGDVCLNRLGVEQTATALGGSGARGRVPGAGGAPEDGAFRICPKLNYRAHREINHLKVSLKENERDSGTVKATLARLEDRLQHERKQNEDLMRNARSRGKIAPLTYGDTVQLEHMQSKNFIGMLKRPALLNTNNYTVALMEDGEAGASCYFRIMPRFKVRSLGSMVFADDEVVLESVQFEGFVLSASTEHACVHASPSPTVVLPRVLRNARQLELSGWLLRKGEHSMTAKSNEVNDTDLGSLISEGPGLNHKCLASFQIKIYARFRDGNTTEHLTTFNKVRLLHPELNGYFCASGNRDKGEMLDSLPLEISQGFGTRTRVGGSHAHCAYLKPLALSDPSAIANLSAKAVWRFEPVEELKAGVVYFNEPLRLRHVATNLFLAIDLEEPGVKVSGSMDQPEVFDASGKDTAEPLFYDCFLTDGGFSSFKSNSSVSPDAMVFRIVSIGEESAELKKGLTMIRIEYRKADGQRLYLSNINDIKPPLIDQMEFTNHDKNQEVPLRPWGRAVTGATESKRRVGFLAQAAGLEAFMVRPVLPVEDEALNSVLKHLEVISLYAQRYLTAVHADDIPVDSCEELVGVLLGLLDLLHKGEPPPRRHQTLADYMNEANNMQAPQFSTANLTGPPNSRVQGLCCQTKLLDTLFAAALAPYNRQLFERGSTIPGPFNSTLTADKPAATQKFIYLCIQRICYRNETVMDYIVRARARVWKKDAFGGVSRSWELWRNLLVDQGEDGYGATVLLAQLFRSSNLISKKLVNDDLLERFKILIKKCGPQVRLINLFASTCVVEGRPMRAFQEACTRKLWMNPIDRYNLGVTFHETTANKVIEAFRGHTPLCYPYGPLAPDDSGKRSDTGRGNFFHKESSKAGPSTKGDASFIDSFDGNVNEYARNHKIRGSHVRYNPLITPPENYLGESETNEYSPVGVVWRSSLTVAWGGTEGRSEREGLYWSPELLGIPSLGKFTYPEGEYAESGDYLGELVPLELLMWVLEPKRLGLAVTGKPFVPFITAAQARSKYLELQHQQSASTRDESNDTHQETKRMTGRSLSLNRMISVKEDFRQQEAVGELFRRKEHFALYIIAEIDLLTSLCRGRCVNAITHLESCFPYTLLLNIASNHWLPYRFRAAVVHLVLVLYVDRYPQLPKSGAVQLPETIWVYEDKSVLEDGQTKKSNVPQVNANLTLDHPEAFPSFFVSPSSMAYGKADPVLSMPNQTKFFLLQSLCNDLLQIKGLVYDDMGDGGCNALTVALLTGEAYLLEFGFSSSICKIKAMFKQNAPMLDGRQDEIRPGIAFDPPELRYRNMGRYSEAVVGIKRAIIEEFFDLADLQANYRLALLLGEFKSKFERLLKEGATSKKASKAGKDQDGDVISKWARGFSAFSLFEGLFQKVLPREADENGGGGGGGGGGVRFTKHDSHTIECSKLSGRVDFNDILMDALLYDNDDLMSSSLRLFHGDYGLRRRLVNSLGDVVLLSTPRLPVYGTVHALRADIGDFAELVATHTVWCVNSEFSGDFDQQKYARLMSVVDMLLEFIYAPQHSGDNADRQSGSKGRGTSLDRTVGGQSSESPEVSTDGSFDGLLGDDTLRSDLQHNLLDGNTKKSKKLRHKVLPSSKGMLEAKSANQKTMQPMESNDTTERSIKVFISAFQQHSREHPEYGSSYGDHCIAIFEKMGSSLVDDGMLDYGELRDGIRNLFGLTPKHMTGKEIAELFASMSNGDESLNFDAFRTFVTTHSDKVNYYGHFSDCDKSSSGDFKSYTKVWSSDIGAKWLDRTRPYAARTATSSDCSVEAKAAAAREARASKDKEKNVTEAAFEPCPLHQHILRGCNLQSVLHAAIQIDPNIAFKVSECTIGLMIESQRRLKLVKQGLLVLYKAFIDKNQTNQEAMFKDLPVLQQIATPVKLVNASETDRSFDERVACGLNGKSLLISKHHYECFKVVMEDKAGMEHKDQENRAEVAFLETSRSCGSPAASIKAWPVTVEEMAQDAIMALVRGNEKLCLKISDDEVRRESLLDLFAFVANEHGQQNHSGEELLASSDCSPALDFFFIVLAPTPMRPLKEFQARVFARLNNASSFGVLAQSYLSCVRRVRTKAEAQRRISAAPLTPQELQSNPYRMVRLLKACCEGGNDEVAVLIASASNMVGVEECCLSLLAHCQVDSGFFSGSETSVPEDTFVTDGEEILRILTPPVRVTGTTVQVGGDLDDASLHKDRSQRGSSKSKLQIGSVEKGVAHGGGIGHDILGCAATTASESYEGGSVCEGGAFDVLALLVEFVDLLPLSASQVQKQQQLWECISRVCVPAIHVLARNRGSNVYTHGHHSSTDRMVCIELVDLLDRLLFRIHSHDLINDLLADQYREGEPIVDDMRNDLKYMAVMHPGTLGKIFSNRTREAVERVFLLCDGSLLPVPKYTRKEPHMHGSELDSSTVTKKISSTKTVEQQSGKKFHVETSIFEAFCDGIRRNPHVQTAILRRRFALLTVLEQGTLADPTRTPKGSVVQVSSWNLLVPRFVRYASEPGRQGMSKKQTGIDLCGYETVDIIMCLLRDHLVKARTLPLDCNGDVVVSSKGGSKWVYDDPRVETLETVDAVDLPQKEDRQLFVSKQQVLLKRGCVELIARIIMAQDLFSEDGDIADVALEVMDEMIHGGNLRAHKHLYEFLCKEDTEGRFLAHLVARMGDSNVKIIEARHFGLLGSLGASMSEDVRMVIENAQQTIQFLTQLCVGHDSRFQNMLRSQPMYDMRTYDLLGMCIELLCSMVDSQQAVKFMSGEELELLRDLLTFLYIIQEGPSAENQLKIALSDVPMAINLIVAADSPIEARFCDADSENGRVPLEALCFRVLAACLEGRKNSLCHDALRLNLEMNLLHEKARALDRKCRVAINRPGKTKPCDDTLEVDMEALAYLWTIHFELFPEMPQSVSRRHLACLEIEVTSMLQQETEKTNNSASSAASMSFATDGTSVAEVTDVIDSEIVNNSSEEVSVDEADRTKRRRNNNRLKFAWVNNGEDEDFGEYSSDSDNEGVAENDDNFDEDDEKHHGHAQIVGTLEVFWDGKTHRVFFPVPLKAQMLTDKSKQLFLDKTRLFHTEKRLELLFGSTDLFIAEMDWVYALSQWSGTYRLIGKNMESLKTLMYSLVVLLNVNVLMSPPSLSHPFNAISEPQFSKLNQNERVSLMLIFILGAINFSGYLLIMGYLAATTVPILIRETDKNNERDRRLKEPAEYTNIGAFKWWFLTLIFNVMFIFMHATNFPQYYGQATGLYTFLIFGINMPWTLSCIRNYIVVPTNPAQRVFIIAFDTIVTKPFLRNHIILQILSIQGFNSSEYFTLMLFDILTISTKLENVTKAVLTHADSLMLILYLFVATTLSYASFGVQYFPKDFSMTYEGVTKTFKTTLSAFWYLLYNFSSKGELNSSLRKPDPKSANWLPRIAFDNAYFIWVGIILFTVVTALLVDSLSKARAEVAEREAEEKNVCFVCGMKREDFDNLALPVGSPSFDDHCSKEHDPWAYVAYAAYLQTRRRLDRTGVESYVHRSSTTEGMEGIWIPAKTSVVLEAHGISKVYAAADVGLEGNRGDGPGGESVAARLSKLESTVAEFASQKSKGGGRREVLPPESTIATPAVGRGRRASIQTESKADAPTAGLDEHFF